MKLPGERYSAILFDRLWTFSGSINALYGEIFSTRIISKAQKVAWQPSYRLKYVGTVI